MAKLSDNEIGACIATVNWGPGGSRDAVVKFLDVAIAVCRAESGGRTNATNQTNDYGLWQINAPSHPDKFENVEDLFDPITNTEVAKQVYNAAGGWSPWVVYKNGSYKSHLGSGEKVYEWLQTDAAEKVQREMRLESWGANEPGALNPGRESSDWWDMLRNPSFLFDAFGQFARQSGKVIGLFVLALFLGVVGLVFLTRNTTVGKLVNPANKLDLAAKIAS